MAQLPEGRAGDDAAPERGSPLRVLGVDPGLYVTGYAVIDLQNGSPALVEAGAIRTPETCPLPERLAAIHRDLLEIVDEFAPGVVGLEAAFSAGAHPRSALQMAHVRAVACLAAGQRGLVVVDINPRTVKSAVVGHGAATKQQVQASVQALYRLDAPPSPPDVADALAIATAVAYRRARPRRPAPV